MNEKRTKLRCELMEGLGRDILKGHCWLLVKNPENLPKTDKVDERARLDEAPKLNRPLAVADYFQWSNNFVLRGSSLARRASEGFTFDNGLPSLARRARCGTTPQSQVVRPPGGTATVLEPEVQTRGRPAPRSLSWSSATEVAIEPLDLGKLRLPVVGREVECEREDVAGVAAGSGVVVAAFAEGRVAGGASG